MSKINKIIPYNKHYIDNNDIKNIIKTLNSDFISSGPNISSFENKIKKYLGGKYCCAVSSGTAALHLTGLALNWKKNDIIVTSPITFVASANSILYSGATPDLVDINYETNCIDLNKLENKLKTKKIRALIAVDYAGYPCDWENLKYLSQKYRFTLINDNCHALGSKLNGDKKYALKYADIAIQSFHPTKNITTGEGGAIITNNKIIHQKIISLRNHGMIKNNNKNYLWKYKIKMLGYNYRITDIQAALGISQMKKIDLFVKKQNSIAQIYDKEFENFEELETLKKRDNRFISYHLYPLKINFKKLKISKNAFFKKMLKNKIRLQVHYIPIHLHDFYKKNYFKNSRLYPMSNIFYEREVSLPMFPFLEKKHQYYIINSLKNNLFKI